MIDIDCDIYLNKINDDNYKNIKWAQIDKEDLKKNIENITCKQNFNINLKNDIEELYSVEKSADIVNFRLHSLKKEYVDKNIHHF